ncbi:MAG TPA: hypothetical protein VFA63_13330, partial [Pseudonocardiaceae bacterium]|nr:hypothetical protein [Pseudonocardiaceae bacterium]
MQTAVIRAPKAAVCIQTASKRVLMGATYDARVSGPERDGTAIQGRSLWQIAWERLKRDKVALGGGIAVVTLML